MRYKNPLLKPVAFLVQEGGGYFLTIEPGKEMEVDDSIMNPIRAEKLGLVSAENKVKKEIKNTRIPGKNDNYFETRKEAILFLDQNTRTTLSRIKKTKLSKDDIKILIEEEKKDTNRKKVLDFLKKF